MQFVEEPVDVEERGGEFVEDEGWAVEIEKGALYDNQGPPLISIAGSTGG